MVNDLCTGQKIRIHDGTEYDRTRQTVGAYVAFLNGDAHDKTINCEIVGHIPADPRLGNKALFDEWTANPDVVADATTRNWYRAFEDYSPLFITRVQLDALAALRNIFAQANDGELIISVGHTPMIEWLAFACDQYEVISRDIKLAELTGFIFTEEFGQITVTGFIKAEI
ncbi:MAG: hypothetical protein HY931_02615 [Candidatus Falkowbacteria bacterium]|nr:MAG: hypothetical protein HY931_02615 [Candidatus Falkowbacteria bacterium]